VQATERRRPGHRHHHAHGRDVDRGVVEEVGGPAKDSHVVVVEPEHDPQMHRDPVAVQVRDDPAVVVDAVVGFVGPLEAFL